MSRDLAKLGYQGVQTCELSFDDFRVPRHCLLGKQEGQGFAQMMRGLEVATSRSPREAQQLSSRLSSRLSSDRGLREPPLPVIYVAKRK